MAIVRVGRGVVVAAAGPPPVPPWAPQGSLGPLRPWAPAALRRPLPGSKFRHDEAAEKHLTGYLPEREKQNLALVCSPIVPQASAGPRRSTREGHRNRTQRAEGSFPTDSSRRGRSKDRYRFRWIHYDSRSNCIVTCRKALLTLTSSTSATMDCSKSNV